MSLDSISTAAMIIDDQESHEGEVETSKEAMASLEASETVTLSFQYKVSRQGNGFQTTVPNLKARNLILAAIIIQPPLAQNGLCLETEVSVSHNGTILKYMPGYFQIFNRINLEDYWYRLADGDAVDLVIKNKSSTDATYQVEYTYRPSEGVIISTCAYQVREFRDPTMNTLLVDLGHAGRLTKLYLRTVGKMTRLALVPLFADSSAEEPPQTISMELDSNEVCLDFILEEELANIVSMLPYYRLDIDFSEDESMIYVLAFGFK